MTQPEFAVTAEAVRRYAEMIDIKVSAAEAATLAEQLAGGFAGLAALWTVDVTGFEPSVTLPIDHW
jgi:hypothetical protein